MLTDKIDVLLQQVSFIPYNRSLAFITCLIIRFFIVLQIEELGSEGKVEEAQGMMKLVEQLKEERELLRSTTSVSNMFVVLSVVLENLVQHLIPKNVVFALKV